MSDPQIPVDHSDAARHVRRAREETRADDYAGPDKWRPPHDDRHAASSLLGVLVAGLVVLMLVVAVYFLLPRDRVGPLGVGDPVRVRLPEAPTTPSMPDLPRAPALQAD